MPNAFDPDGRYVQLPIAAIAKVVRGHPEMEAYVEEILEVVAHPDHRDKDPYPLARRERYFKSGVGPRLWMRVVVQYGDGMQSSQGVVVTAFAQDHPPSQ